MQSTEENQESHKKCWAKISFPWVCLNHSFFCLVCIVSYLRLCVAGRDWLGWAVLLPHCFVFIGVFFSFLKLFFLPVVYVRTGLPFHRQSGNTKGAQKRGVRGNRLCSDTAEVAIDGTLNKKQGNKDCLTYPPCCRQTERQTDFRRLQNEPRPGRECRWDSLFSFFFSSATENSGMRCESQRRRAYCFARGTVITRHTLRMSSL